MTRKINHDQLDAMVHSGQARQAEIHEAWNSRQHTRGAVAENVGAVKELVHG